MAAGPEQLRRPRRKVILSDSLPATMVTQLEALGTALLTVAKEHRDASLATLEKEVLAVVRLHLPRLLEEVVKTSTTALQPSLSHWQQPCPECGQRSQSQQWRQRTLKTVCGSITFERPWFVCDHCQHNFSTVDTTLALESRARLSEGVRQWIIGLGASTSFAEAAYWLETLTGLSVSAESIRQHTECRGQQFEAAQQLASERVKETHAPAEPLDPAPGMLVVETDGVQVRYLDGWHEVKLGLVAGQEDGALAAPSYIAARESVDAFGSRLLAEAARRGAMEVVAWEGSVTQPGLAVLREVVVLGDGAPWIWNLAAEHFGERTEIIDFYHASEHVWKVAKALHGEGTEAAKTWAGERIAELLQEGAAPVQKALAEAQGETVEATEVLRVERGYFGRNAARMDYPTYRALGLPIGSGAVESSAKYLVQQRMKRPGARWSEFGAQGVLNVRSRLLSGLSLAS
jgi:hypothetical protein